MRMAEVTFWCCIVRGAKVAVLFCSPIDRCDKRLVNDSACTFPVPSDSELELSLEHVVCRTLRASGSTLHRRILDVSIVPRRLVGTSLNTILFCFAFLCQSRRR